MEIIKVTARDRIPDNFTGIVEYENRTKYWRKNGKLHREDGPAIEEINGHKEWWINGNLHREDGPAVEYSDGAKEWWFEYTEYYEECLLMFIETCIVLDVEKSNGGTYWIKFLDEDSIIKYPYIPGMVVDIDISSIIK